MSKYKVYNVYIYCQAKHFNGEKATNKGNSFHDCCGYGKKVLDDSPHFSEYLRNLFDGSDPNPLISSNSYKEL